MEENQVSTAPETQNQAPELAETPEIATPEAATEQTEQPKEPDTADKAVKGLLRRVDRLTAAKYQEQARAQQAAQEAEQLRQRLAQYEAPSDKEQLTPESVLPIAQQLAQQLREQERTRETVQSVLSKGKTLEGFDAACNTVNEVLPFYERNGSPSGFLRAVLEGDAPEKVLHYLGSNPDVAEELAGLSPTQVARRLDRIERKLSEPAEPKETAAPKPLPALKGVATGTKDPSQMSDREFAEWRKRQIAQRR